MDTNQHQNLNESILRVVEDEEGFHVPKYRPVRDPSYNPSSGSSNRGKSKKDKFKLPRSAKGLFDGPSTKKPGLGSKIIRGAAKVVGSAVMKGRK